MNLMMFKEVILTAEEAQFLKDTETVSSRSASGLNLRNIMIEMYSIKHTEKNTYALMNSNKELARSNEKHAKAMRYLTGALAGVALIQVIVAIIALF